MDYTTWADLDKANSNHYGRGKPIAIHNAMNAMCAAWKKHLDMVDEYECGNVAREEIAMTSLCYDIVSRYYDRLYARWMAGTLTTDRLDALRDAIDAADQIDMMRNP